MCCCRTKEVEKKIATGYFGLDIFDLEDVIIKNRDKILRLGKQPLKDHRANINNLSPKHRKAVFEQCELCDKWIKVRKESFDPDGHSFWSMLSQAPDNSNRWVCSECWDIIDVAYYGPYTHRPKKYMNNYYYTHPEEVEEVNKQE